MPLVVRERDNDRLIANGEPENGTVLKFEGNWYFAPEAVDFAHLKVTERIYTCPYKGICYWIDLDSPNGARAQNIAWVYRQPKPGYEAIKDRIGFYARDTAGTNSVIE